MICERYLLKLEIGVIFQIPHSRPTALSGANMWATSKENGGLAQD